MNDVAIILASGASRRMGTPKALFRWRGETLLERALRITLEAELSTFIVLGAHREEILAQSNLQGATLIENPHWELGMGHSIATAVTAIPEGWSRLLLLNVDQPLIEVAHLRRLVDGCKDSIDATVTRYESGLTGTPACFSSRLHEDLQNLNGDKGARQILRSGSLTLAEIPGSGRDLDTPEDWAAFLKEYGP